jgi:hypothetical protein
VRSAYEALDRKTRRKRMHVHGIPRCNKDGNIKFILNEQDEMIWTSGVW